MIVELNGIELEIEEGTKIEVSGKRITITSPEKVIETIRVVEVPVYSYGFGQQYVGEHQPTQWGQQALAEQQALAGTLGGGSTSNTLSNQVSLTNWSSALGSQNQAGQIYTNGTMQHYANR